VTQNDPKETEIRWGATHWHLLCFLGMHKWEAHSLTRDGKVYTYNRCVRDCPRYGHWRFVNAAAPEEP
jgi:hypothetical protein